MKLEERLGANKYYVDETSPHILVDGAGFSLEEKMKLVNGCPAGLYTLQDNGDLAFDFAGCLECGTCRVLCGETIVKTWKYPRNAKGVEFIKQVPDTSEIKLDPETNNLIRTGLPSIVNPDDMHALEAALAVKDQYEGSRVTVLSMGPPQAEAALRECLSLGADDAVLVTDRAFGGADTLATSYTIASAIRHIQRTMNRQFQIIFCGKQAIDGDTAQVGPQIAEELGMAQATYACELSVDQGAQKAVVKRQHENGYEIVEVPLPLLVTATAELNEPRQPGLWSSIYAKRYTISHITLRDMPSIDESRIGLNGSPTRVRKVYQPPLRGKVEMLPSIEEGAKKILELAYHIKPEKFAHLLVPNDAPVEVAEDNDEGVDVKDPVQRAASVESVSPSEFKAVAAAKGTEGSKGGDR